MKYIDVKNELIESCKSVGNLNFEEIDYCFCELKHCSKTNLLFCDIDKKTIKKAKKILTKHIKTKKPLQKIFKKAYFFGLEFFVNTNVLTPRFDSEILVENALKFDFNSCLDLCCGSGCLGLSLKKNRPNIKLVLADISKKAQKVAKINAKKLKIEAEFVKTNMFEKINDKFDLIICNPPYIETNVIKSLDDGVKNYDPILALDGGRDGLKFYNILLKQLDQHLTTKGKCLIEIGYNQGYLLDLFKQKFEKVKLIKDYNNLDRVLLIEK